MASSDLKAEKRLNDMFDLMAAARKGARIKAAGALLARPENSVTVNEYARMFNIHKFTAQRELNAMVDAGTATEHLVMLPNEKNNRVTAQKVYEPVVKPKK